MKKIFILIGAFIILGIIGTGFYLYQSRTVAPTAVTTTRSVFSGSGTTNQKIATDFVSQIPNADQISLGDTYDASPYALQVWGDENKGGEALLKLVNGKWTLVSLGGGAWDHDSLIAAGVPEQNALILLQAQQND